MSNSGFFDRPPKDDDANLREQVAEQAKQIEALTERIESLELSHANQAT